MRGSLFGYVVRGDIQRPVAGALVSIASATAPTAGVASEHNLLTDNSGWFAREDLPEGTWRVTAVAPGGGCGEALVSVFENALSEVTVSLDGLHSWFASSFASHVQADAAALPQAGDVDGDLDEDNRTVSSDDALPALVFREPIRTGGIRGRVVYGPQGTPVAGATITIERGAGPAPDIAPETNSKGEFTINHLPWGLYQLGAVDPHGKRGYGKVEVSASKIFNVVIKVH